MKFIIHRSQASLADHQSQALAEQLTTKLEAGNHSYQFVDVEADLSQLKLTDFNVQDNETHMVILSGENDFLLAKHFKSLEFAPKIIWSGLSIPECATEIDCILPDICVAPKWMIDDLCKSILDEKTNLISTDLLCHNIDEIALNKSKAQLQQMPPLPEVNNKSLAVIQLGGDVINSSGQLIEAFTVKQAQLFAKSVAKIIIGSALDLDNILVVIASSLTTGLYDDTGNKLELDPHIAGIDKVTMAFMRELNQELTQSNIESKSIKLVPAVIDRLDASLALLALCSEAPEALYFAPSSNTELVLQSTSASIQGVNVISYGDKPSIESQAMQLGGFVRTMSYSGDFKASLHADLSSPLLRNSMSIVINNIFDSLIKPSIAAVVLEDISSFARASDLFDREGAPSPESSEFGSLDGHDGDTDDNSSLSIEELIDEIETAQPRHVIWQEDEFDHDVAPQVNNNVEPNQQSTWQRTMAAAGNADISFWAKVGAVAGVVAIAGIALSRSSK